MIGGTGLRPVGWGGFTGGTPVPPYYYNAN